MRVKPWQYVEASSHLDQMMAGMQEEGKGVLGLGLFSYVSRGALDCKSVANCACARNKTADRTSNSAVCRAICT